MYKVKPNYKYSIHTNNNYLYVINSKYKIGIYKLKLYNGILNVLNYVGKCFE